jgi:asparagine synthase (glutamine-hydrolysing)
MNGIAGIVYSDVFHMSNFIEPMLKTMAFQKDLSTDICKIKNVQIGAAGLSISSNKDNSLFGCLNGTLLNQTELCQELGSSDILIAAYEKWGTGAFSRFNGDFSLMLFDQKKGALFLARDRIGKKNLYWFHDGRQLIFASNLKAMLATGIVPQTIARDGIAAYFYLGYIPQDMSPVQGVNKLLPAYYLEYNTSGTLYIRSYWSYSSCFKEIKKEPREVQEHLDHLLRQSIGRHLLFAKQKDPLIGCAISGGLGSATIAHYLKQEQINGFTAGFQGENEEDVKAAKEVALTLGIPHDFELISPQNGLDPLVNIVWHLDEPLADPNILATWQLFRLAGRKTGSIFSGMGSDELLAGHTRYTLTGQPFRFWQKSRFTDNILIPLLKWFSRSSLYSLLKKTRTNPSQFRYLSENAILTEKQAAAAAPKLKGLFAPETFLNKFQSLYRFQSNKAAYLYFDVKTRLCDCYLLQYERLSSANHLDLYTPFLDRNIVEYTASVIEEGNILKEMFRDVFPESVVFRPKVSRPHFLQSWMKEPKVFEILQLLKKGLLVENGIISKQWVQEALAGKAVCRSTFQGLFAILVLEVWFRLFINHPITPAPPENSLHELLSMR